MQFKHQRLLIVSNSCTRSPIALSKHKNCPCSTNRGHANFTFCHTPSYLLRTYLLWGYHTTTRTPTSHHELINFRIRGISLIFVSIRDVLRYCNDTVTIALRLFGGGVCCIRLESHEYAKIPSRFTRIYSEYCTNQLKIRRKVRNMYE